jgi:hypothetical protein
MGNRKKRKARGAKRHAMRIRSKRINQEKEWYKRRLRKRVENT